MKYERLSSEQLASLESEFIMFLASQGIDAPQWEQLKADEPSKATGLIDIFSDVVWEKALQKAQFLEYVSATEFRAYRFGESEVHLIIAKAKAGSAVNLNTPDFSETLKQGLTDQTIELYTAHKDYSTLRELEMIATIREGAYLATDGWYTTLQRILN